MLRALGCHLAPGVAPSPTATAVAPTDGLYTAGAAPFRYSYAMDRMALPQPSGSPGGLMANGHGMCVDSRGRIYYTFDPELLPEQRGGVDMAVLLRWGPDGTGEPEILGPTAEARQTLAQGRPHGLICTTELGVEYLYHINDGKGTESKARIIKSTLEGEIVWESTGSPVWPGLPYVCRYCLVCIYMAAIDRFLSDCRYLPTSAVLIPGSTTLLVCDGYGSSFVHGISTTDGSYIQGSSFGKLGEGSIFH